jgi:hypothetical protein
MTMMAERSGSCSTVVAPLDLLELEEEEGVAALVSEGLALEEEVETGNYVSVKKFKKVTQKVDREPFEHSSF